MRLTDKEPSVRLWYENKCIQAHSLNLILLIESNILSLSQKLFELYFIWLWT